MPTALGRGRRDARPCVLVREVRPPCAACRGRRPSALRRGGHTAVCPYATPHEVGTHGSASCPRAETYRPAKGTRPCAPTMDLIPLPTPPGHILLIKPSA